MKKNLLTMALVAFGLTLSAQTLNSFKSSKTRSKVEVAAQQPIMLMAQKVVANEPMTSYILTTKDIKNNQAAVKRAATDVSAFYGFQRGTLYYGISSEGWYKRQDIYTPALTEIKFINYSGYDESDGAAVPTFTWKDGSDKDMDQTEDGDGIAQLFGADYVPTLTVTQGTATSTYQNTNNNYKSVWWGGMGSYEPLSNASPTVGVYGGFSDLSCYDLNQPFSKSDEGKKLVGVAEYYTKPLDVTEIENIYVQMYTTDDNATISETAPFNGQTLKAQIFTFDEEGNLVPYAEATATDDDASVNTQYKSVYVTFTFKENDPAAGEIEVPVVLPDEDFMVIITGFEGVTTGYTVPFAPPTFDKDGNVYVAGYGYGILEDGSIATIGYTSQPNIPQTNLHIGFSAIIPVAVLDDEEVEVAIPVEGGWGIAGQYQGEDYQYIIVNTMSDVDDWDIVDAPDWVDKFDYQNTVTDDSGAETSTVDKGWIAFYLGASEALPAGTEGRGGYVTLECHGKQIAIPVKQGEFDFTGIQAPKADVVLPAKYAGKTFNLAGQQVSANAKGLVIKNGKKFMNK